MERDDERRERVRRAMWSAGLHALVCRLPHNILMLSGYWPVLADSTLVFPLHGGPVLIVPAGEEQLAARGSVTDIRAFSPVTLEKLSDSRAEVEPMLADLAGSFGLGGAYIGYEGGLDSMPAPYAEIIAPLPWIEALYRRAFGASLIDATVLLRELRQTKTPLEIERIRLAHHIAAFGFAAAKEAIRPGLRESELAAIMHGAVVTQGTGYHGARRIEASAFAMSGPNGAQAYLPFQQTSDRVIERGDFVLAHLNSCADGYWTDVTRTFVAGAPNPRQRAIYEAVHAGLEAGLGAVRAGVRAADVDAAARRVLDERGYGAAFKHGLGHGVGFKAIYHSAPPILHPQSTDVLQAGMVHNVETGIYTEDLGIRIADVVVDRPDGAEVLSEIPRDLEWATGKG
jgi:Xaa-Pro aminopeptidase